MSAVQTYCRVRREHLDQKTTTYPSPRLGQNLQASSEGCAVREAALPRKLPVEPGFRRAARSSLTAAGGAEARL